MAQCPECGNIDSSGLGFCTICGRAFPKPATDEGRHSDASELTGGQMLDDVGETMQKVYTSLIMVAMMALFMLLFLLTNGTDPVLILMVEMFPIMWFLIILIQWRLIKGKSGN
ncbi:MAG: hypothetical protein WC375_06865 [Methanomassiliicoccales archaeon]